MEREKIELQYFEKNKPDGELTYSNETITSPSIQSDEENNININYRHSKAGRKTDKEREESAHRREWTDEEIIRLIQLWRENSVLYDSDHPLYYVQGSRREAIEKMSEVLSISTKDINDKMHSLRTYYGSQRQRSESAIQRNPLSNNIIPKWKFYEQMSFLYESVSMRAAKSQCNGGRSRRKVKVFEETPSSHGNFMAERHETSALENMYQDSNEMTEEDDSGRFSTFQNEGTQTKRMRLSEPLTGEKERETREEANNEADELFSSMITCSLRQMRDERQKEYLKLQIQKLIYEIRFPR